MHDQGEGDDDDIKGEIKMINDNIKEGRMCEGEIRHAMMRDKR